MRTLSGGQKQRLSLACALVGDPELLFLDEPTTGLDPQSRRQIWDVVRGVQGRGRTVLLTTHYMEEAERLCDRVAIVDHGKVIALGTPRELVASLGAEHVVEFAVDEPGADERRGRAADAAGRGARPREDGRWRLTVREVHRAVPPLLAALAARGLAPKGWRRTTPAWRTCSWRSPAGSCAMADQPNTYKVRSALTELTLARIRELTREPEAIFWVFVFPHPARRHPQPRVQEPPAGPSARRRRGRSAGNRTHVGALLRERASPPSAFPGGGEPGSGSRSSGRRHRGGRDAELRVRPDAA